MIEKAFPEMPRQSGKIQLKLTNLATSSLYNTVVAWFPMQVTVA